MQREIQYDDVFDAQEHYRLLLDCMARPGKINTMPRLELTAPAGIHAAGALVGFALLNSDASFYVAGPAAEEISRYLLVNTAARPVEKEQADFIFTGGMAQAELLQRLKVGSLPYPEEGATVVVAAGALAGEGEGLRLVLSGPGVEGEKRLAVAGVDAAFFEALQSINGEFPLGIDLILTDPEQRVACIPRSARVQLEQN